MNPEFWIQVENAYLEAAALPQDAIAPFLEREYHDRPDIRDEVETLLKHRAAANRLTPATVFALAAEVLVDDEDNLIGTTVAGKYQIRNCLGGGAQAKVYLADHIALDTPFALKRPNPEYRTDPSFRRRFLEEARRAVVLKHQNVARVHDVIDVGDDMFVVMEYVEGETLRSLINKKRSPGSPGRAFTFNEFLPIAIQCAAALAAAHEKRIVHLDVKPENIMLTPTKQVKICDFGVARRLASGNPTDTTTVSNWTFAGTPAYMAPEVILSYQFDERADLFALGIVFYEMLTGINPFQADTVVATTARIVSEVAPPVSKVNPEVQPKLEQIVMRLLAKDPDQRYAKATDVIHDLEAARRSRDRVSDIIHSIQEAFAEPAWMKPMAIVFLLCLAAAFPAWFYREGLEHWLGYARLPASKVVVVLPFRVVGDSPGQPYSDGLTETLTAMLTQLPLSPKLAVIPASAVRADGVTTPEEAFKSFAANLVLDGSIQPVDDQLRINLALVDTKQKKQLRGTSFTVPKGESLRIQNEITEAAIRLLEIEFEASQQSSLSIHSTNNSGAYSAYLEGVGYLASLKPENIERSIQSFREALVLDASFSLAYAGLGKAYWAQYIMGKDPQQRLVDRARDVCEQALSLDSKLAAGRVCLGTIYNGIGKYEAAAEEFRRALDSEPNNDEAYRELARSYERLNNWEAAEATYLKAIDVRPSYWYSYLWLAQFYMFSRQQYGDAIETYQKAIDRAPDNAGPYFGQCGAYLFAGRYPDAIKSCNRSIELGPTAYSYMNLGVAYWDLRQYPLAAQSFEHAVQLNPRYYTAVGHLARTYSRIPERRAEAAGLYRRAILLADEELKINPRDPNVNVMVARYHAMLANRTEAFSHLQIALNLRPKDFEYQVIAAVIHNQFGEVTAAFGYLERAIAGGYSLTEIDAERELDNLREDPRFRALIANQRGKEESHVTTKPTTPNNHD
ncbi:MAG TPA: protein kinase [Terriglobia bacterium]|nr:protein kinase [Terriglobia bacterium]